MAKKQKTAETSKAEAPKTEAREVDQSGASWYVVHTYSGHENKVKSAIEQRIGNLNLKDYIFDIKTPDINGFVFSKDRANAKLKENETKEKATSNVG